MHEQRHKLTLCDTAAKPTLEAAASLYELHVRTHVGFATVAADRTTFAVVHQICRALMEYKVEVDSYTLTTRVTQCGFNYLNRICTAPHQ